MTLARLAKIFTRYPEVEQATSYGTPAFRVREKLLTRMYQTEKAIVLHIADLEEQETLIKIDPEVFYVTDHYSGHPYVLARLSTVAEAKILDVFEAARRLSIGNRSAIASCRRARARVSAACWSFRWMSSC